MRKQDPDKLGDPWFPYPDRHACTDCGRTTCEIVGHHQDYSKPDEVVPLCRSCHMKRHGRRNGADRHVRRPNGFHKKGISQPRVARWYTGKAEQWADGRRRSNRRYMLALWWERRKGWWRYEIRPTFLLPIRVRVGQRRKEGGGPFWRFKWGLRGLKYEEMDEMREILRVWQEKHPEQAWEDPLAEVPF